MVQKSLLFVSGIAVGLILAFAFGLVSNQPDIEQETVQALTEKTPEIVTPDTILVVKTDTIVQEIVKEIPFSDSAIKAFDDSLKKSLLSDTLVFQPDTTESIKDFSTIEEEELLFSKTLLLKQTSKTDSSRTIVDSLLAKQTQIDIQPEKIVVEFWEHPFYKSGYVKNGRVVRLYGFTPDQTIQLKTLEQKQYLNLNGSFYYIQNTFNLLPLEPVSDSLILIQLIEN